MTLLCMYMLFAFHRWMEACLEDELPPTTAMEQALRNGVFLARLSNFFAPEVVPLKKIYDIDESKYRVGVYVVVCSVYRYPLCMKGPVLCAHMHSFTTKWRVQLYMGACVHRVNTRKSTAICFQRIWWINEFGGLTEYSYIILVLENCGRLQGLLGTVESHKGEYL